MKSFLMIRVRDNCFGVCEVPCPCNDQSLDIRVTTWPGNNEMGDWIRCLVRLTPRNSETFIQCNPKILDLFLITYLTVSQTAAS